VDILDSDGSGSVSTVELREGLLLCSAELGVAGGIVDCKLKVREVQQWLRNRIEPQLHIVQDLIMAIHEQRHQEQAKIQKTLDRLLEHHPLNSNAGSTEEKSGKEIPLSIPKTLPSAPAFTQGTERTIREVWL